MARELFVRTEVSRKLIFCTFLWAFSYIVVFNMHQKGTTFDQNDFGVAMFGIGRLI